MADKEINLTYETLFELLRREKTKAELQKLDNSFYSDLIDYMKEKKNLLEEKRKNLSLENQGDVTKLMLQFENIRKIVKELYERREKKISTMALLSSRMEQNATNDVNMLNEEKQLFSDLQSLLGNYRSFILENLFMFKTPQILKLANKMEETEKGKTNLLHKDTLLVRFLNPLPKFLGENLESHGPFEEEEIAPLPLNIAKVLLSKGRVEKIEEEH